MAADDKTPAALVRQTVERHAPAWEPYHQAIEREDRFLEGERYRIDYGEENLDRRLTQIRGQEIQDTIRHFCGEATSKPRSVEARGIDAVGDEELAEIEVALVENLLRDPWKGFESEYYDAVYDSRALRTGIVWADWYPGFGPYGGEIFFRTIDPRRAMWDECYHPHHPMCSFFLERRRCDVDWIHENYKGTDWVKPDREAYTGAYLKAGITPIRVGGSPMMPSTYDDNKAELWFCWYKNDRTYAQRDSGRERMIPPGMRYMSCTSGCGYRTPTQHDLGARGKRQVLPPMLEQGCPDCGGDLQRIDGLGENEVTYAFPRGNRLTITAPFSSSGDDGHVYDGKWPIPRLRSFPGLFLRGYVAPRKPMGKSDVNLMWDQQVASDNLATLILQRVFEHRTYWDMPSAGYTDRAGNRWEFGDGQENVMFRDITKASLGPLDVRVYNASGVDAAGWQLAWGMSQNKLTTYRGVTDYGLTPDTTRQIPVGTVERLTQQGNIPVEEYNRRKNHELSKFYGVISDMVHATYTPQRLQRLNIDGIDHAMGLWGQDMPNFDFVVEETPEFTGLDKRRSEAFSAFMQVLPMALQLGLNPADVLEAFAAVNNLPKSVTRAFEKAIESAQQGAAPPAGGMGAGGGPGAPPPDLLALLAGAGGAPNGSNGAGMVPAPQS